LLVDRFLEKIFSIASSKFPDLKIIPADNFGLIINDTAINLDNLYRSCVIHPEKQDTLIHDFIKSFTYGPRLVINSFDDIKNKLFPQIKPVEFFNNPVTSHLVKTPFLDFLSVCFVYEDGKTFRFIHEDLFPEKFPEIDTVYKTALENVRRSSLNISMRKGTFENISFIALQGTDGLSAVRILLPDFYGNVSKTLGPSFLVGIPFRDFLIAFEHKPSPAADKMIARIQQDYSTRTHPITDRIIIMDAKGIRRFKQ
jgi:hypothetical protein